MNRATSLVFAGLLVACSRGKSLSQPSSAASVAHRDSARTPERTDSSSHLPADSTTGRPFDPDGYYFPDSQIIVQDVEIKLIAIHTLDYPYNGKIVDFDHPKPSNDHQLLQLMSATDSTRGLPGAICDEQRITPDTLHLRCVSPILGVARIDGNFLDRRGDFSNLFSNDTHPEYVLRAVITVEREGKLVYQSERRFSYFVGD